MAWVPVFRSIALMCNRQFFHPGLFEGVLCLRLLHGLILLWGISIPPEAVAQKPMRIKFTDPGIFAVGLRYDVGAAWVDSAIRIAQGPGVQCRLLLIRKLNLEGYLGLHQGIYNEAAFRRDVLMELAAMYYPQRRLQRVAPFLLLGGGMNSVALVDRSNLRRRVGSQSPGLQLGMGFHVHLTWRSDLTLAATYRSYYTSRIELLSTETVLATLPPANRRADGRLSMTLSMNYKITDLWKVVRFR